MANNDADMLEMLRESRTIAVVGLSSNPFRPSLGVSEYMQGAGYRIVPINPKESEVLGEKAFPSLADAAAALGASPEMVNVFRQPDAVPQVVEEAIAAGAKYLWLQEGVTHEEAERRARAAGLKVVSDRCLFKEHRRLGL
jgi:uncharacterized protein